MKVRDLIAKLQELRPDLEVVVSHDDEGYAQVCGVKDVQVANAVQVCVGEKEEPLYAGLCDPEHEKGSPPPGCGTPYVAVIWPWRGFGCE